MKLIWQVYSSGNFVYEEQYTPQYLPSVRMYLVSLGYVVSLSLRDLKHWGPVTPYGDMELSGKWFW